MPVLSLGGNKHELEIVDETSGCLFGVPMKKKSESGTSVIEVVNWMEQQTGRKVKRIFCDGAGEFIGTNKENGLGRWAASNGVEIIPSTPYTSNENSVAENAHKRREESARTIRLRANLPQSFWAEANHFARIAKAKVLSAGKEKTPYETFYGHKPTANDIHVFGCHAFSWIPPEK
jgi:hypothetical protein